MSLMTSFTPDYIDREIKRLRQVLRDMETAYERHRGQVREDIRFLQAQCEHREIRFDPDPSGNNDSTETCLVCGRSAKNL